MPDKLLNELPNDGSGPDLFRFPNASAFASNLALCPDREITGGKVALTRTRKLKSRAALALRLGAQALHHSATYLGDFFRRMRGKLGTPQAITATALKLSRIVYTCCELVRTMMKPSLPRRSRFTDSVWKPN